MPVSSKVLITENTGGRKKPKVFFLLSTFAKASFQMPNGNEVGRHFSHFRSLESPDEHMRCSVSGLGVADADFRQSYSSPALGTVRAGLFFIVGACPVHCGAFSRVPGLYPLDTRCTHASPRCDNHKGLQTLSHVPEGKVTPH